MVTLIPVPHQSWEQQEEDRDTEKKGKRYRRMGRKGGVKNGTGCYWKEISYYFSFTHPTHSGNKLLFPDCVGCVKLIGSMLGAYGEAGNGNKMETGNGDWKLKPEIENRNGNATSLLL